MAKLPESYEEQTYEEQTIEGMLPGDIGYTVPWAMWADSDRTLWINGHYTIHNKPFRDTVHMKIQRTATGVIVFQGTIGDHKYSPHDCSWIDWSLPVELR